MTDSSDILDRVAARLGVDPDMFAEEGPVASDPFTMDADTRTPRPDPSLSDRGLVPGADDADTGTVPDDDDLAPDVPVEGEGSPATPPSTGAFDDGDIDDELPVDPDATVQIVFDGDGDGVDDADSLPLPTDPSPPAPQYEGMLDRYFHTAYGEEPSLETINKIEQNLGFVARISSLPAESQQVIQSVLDGTFDPAAFYTPPPTPTSTPAPTRTVDPWGLEDDLTPPVPAADPRVDVMAQELAALRAHAQQQQQAAQQQQYAIVEKGVTDATSTFMAEHPELDTIDVAALRKRVHDSAAWAVEVQRGVPADVAYRRQLEAHLAVDPNLKSKVLPPATPPAVTTARQATSAAIAGTSSPARRRRSTLDSSPTAPSTAHNRGELNSQIVAYLEGSN